MLLTLTVIIIEKQKNHLLIGKIETFLIGFKFFIYLYKNINVGFYSRNKKTLLEIDRLFESIDSFNLKNKKLNEGVQVQDISNTSTFSAKPLPSKKYFILHHTAGRSSASGVVDILNQRGLGIQYVIDREGKVFKTLPSGTKGAHVKSIGRSAPGDLSNSTTEGVEIVGSNDADILPKQCKSALLLVKSLGYSLNSVYGHGEVSTNKALDEGKTCKEYFKKYWDTPENELPEGGDTKTKTSNEEPKKEEPKKEEPKKVVPTTTTTTTSSMTSDEAKSKFSDIFGVELKESKSFRQILIEAANGDLPDSMLVNINKPDGSKGDAKLNDKAAADFNKMVADAKKEGVDIIVSQGYRKLGDESRGCSDGFTQWCAWKKYKAGTGNLAAKPGTSNHGFGSAIDVKNCSVGSKVHTWLKNNSTKYGFHPLASESWHWDHKGSASSLKSGSSNTPEPEKKEPEKKEPEKKEPEKKEPEKTTSTTPEKKEPEKSIPYFSIFKSDVFTEQKINEDINKIKNLMKKIL
jgi:LAS superfamily LD-carboxypeptidase LdcB